MYVEIMLEAERLKCCLHISERQMSLKIRDPEKPDDVRKELFLESRFVFWLTNKLARRYRCIDDIWVSGSRRLKFRPMRKVFELLVCVESRPCQVVGCIKL